MVDNLANVFIDYWDGLYPRGGLVTPDQNNSSKRPNF
jgi:hypothetical protein